MPYVRVRVPAHCVYVLAHVPLPTTTVAYTLTRKCRLEHQELNTTKRFAKWDLAGFNWNHVRGTKFWGWLLFSPSLSHPVGVRLCFLRLFYLGTG